MLTMLGVANYSLGKKEAARAYLDKALTAGVKDSKALLYGGYLRFEAKDYKGAAEALSAAERAGEKEDGLYLIRGKSYYQQKEYTAAIPDLEKGVQKGTAGGPEAPLD